MSIIVHWDSDDKREIITPQEHKNEVLIRKVSSWEELQQINTVDYICIHVSDLRNTLNELSKKDKSDKLYKAPAYIIAKIFECEHCFFYSYSLSKDDETLSTQQQKMKELIQQYTRKTTHKHCGYGSKWQFAFCDEICGEESIVWQYLKTQNIQHVWYDEKTTYLYRLCLSNFCEKCEQILDLSEAEKIKVDLGDVFTPVLQELINICPINDINKMLKNIDKQQDLQQQFMKIKYAIGDLVHE